MRLVGHITNTKNVNFFFDHHIYGNNANISLGTKIQEEVIKTNMEEYFSRIPFEENLLYLGVVLCFVEHEHNIKAALKTCAGKSANNARRMPAHYVHMLCIRFVAYDWGKGPGPGPKITAGPWAQNRKTLCNKYWNTVSFLT